MSAIRSCCSIVSDQPQGNLQIIETVKANPLNGGVAQLGEHLPCKQGVKGSIPFISTRPEIPVETMFIENRIKVKE